MGQRVAGDRVVVGRCEHDANAPRPDKRPQSAGHLRLRALNVEMEDIRPVDAVLVHQRLQGCLRRRAQAFRRGADGAVFERHGQIIQRGVAPAQRKSVRVRLQPDGAAAGGIAGQEPEGIIGPVTPQLHHRPGVWKRVKQSGEQRLFLRLMNPIEVTDQARRPFSAISAGENPDAAVHGLNRRAIRTFRHFAGAGHAGQMVGVAAGGGHLSSGRNVDLSRRRRLLCRDEIFHGAASQSLTLS